MRKVKKFAKGGGTGRADAMRDRRMADIESDYKRAIARGVSEKEARAKRAQREADARDDYAKRTGADRTQTRAAERAAETRLSAARRSPDKDMKPVSVASEGPSRKPLVDTSVKADTPSPGRQSFSSAFAAARKAGEKTFTWNGTSYTTEMRGGKKPTAATSKPGRGSSTRGDKKPTSTSTSTSTSTPAPTPAPTGNTPPAALRSVSEIANRSLAPTPGSPTRDAKLDRREAVGRFLSAPIRALAKNKYSDKAKGGKVKGYAKGGKIDGAAIRGKTRAKRNK
jgi:hypothetical protein